MQSWSDDISNSQCYQHEFGCHDGKCIPLEHRCDGVPDCESGFDELNCTIIIKDDWLYQKQFFPHQRYDDGTNVRVSYEIFSVSMINEIAMTFTVTLFISLEW